MPPSPRSRAGWRTVFLLAAFVGGVHALFRWRFTAGDAQPPYSSYRADPMGVRVLYEAVSSLPRTRAVRNRQPLAAADLPAPGALLIVAAPPGWWRGRPAADADALAAFARRGGRIIGALPADAWREAEVGPDSNRLAQNRRSAPTNDASRAARRPPPRAVEAPAETRVSMLNVWGVDIVASRPSAAGAVSTNTSDGLPWTSPMWFRTNAPGWTVWLRCGDRPVVIERPWHGGRVVLASDSYLFSNEAMLRHRRTSLLARMFDGMPSVCFDEEHLGLGVEVGTLEYILRLRLAGVFGALLLAAALAIWRQSTSLLPPSPPAALPSPADGFEYRDGFVRLLQRHVPPRRLIEVCVQEWRRTAPREVVVGRRANVERRVSEAGGASPVQIYRDVQDWLSRKE